MVPTKAEVIADLNDSIKTFAFIKNKAEEEMRSAKRIHDSAEEHMERVKFRWNTLNNCRDILNYALSPGQIQRIDEELGAEEGFLFRPFTGLPEAWPSLRELASSCDSFFVTPFDSDGVMECVINGEYGGTIIKCKIKR